METIELPEQGTASPPLPEVDDVTRREFLVGAAGLLVLGAAGCGGEQDAEGSSGETRAVRHALGRTDVPLRPQRPIMLYGTHLAHALAVGVTPVAAGAYYNSPPHFHPAIPEAEQAKVEPLIAVERQSTNIEAIAALNPDVIVGYDYLIEELGGDLSRIAPTVATEFPYGAAWQEEFMLVGEALGRRERAEEVLAELDEAIGSARDSLSDSDVSVSAVRVRPGEVRVYNQQVFGGWVLKELGIEVTSDLPPSVFEEGVRQANISLERLTALDGDVLFVPEDDRLDEGGAENRRALRAAQQLPLWRQLPAVRAGRVHSVNAQVWEDGTVQGAYELLDLFEKTLAR
jgi:iron complex transport system substrate-binding protein